VKIKREKKWILCLSQCDTVTESQENESDGESKKGKEESSGKEGS